MRDPSRRLLEIPIRKLIQDFQTQTEASRALGQFHQLWMPGLVNIYEDHPAAIPHYYL